jgi:hypothetical protein
MAMSAESSYPVSSKLVKLYWMTLGGIFVETILKRMIVVHDDLHRAAEVTEDWAQGLSR